MPLIIDTYNVLHVTGILPPELAVAEVEELASLISLSRFGNDVTWLICDGVPKVGGKSGSHRLNRCVIEGAGHGRTADEHIAAFLARESAPRRLTVVSSDRAVARNAKRRGADTLKSEEFLEMLAHDTRKAKRTVKRTTGARASLPLNECEAHGWMRLFGITAEQAAIQSAPALARNSIAPASTPSTTPSTTPAPTPARSAPAGAPASAPHTRARSNDALLEQFLAATKDLADPLSILDSRKGSSLLTTLGELDDATLDALMARYEPTTEKDGARVGSKRRTTKRR